MAGALRAHGQPLRAPGRLLEAGMVLALELRPELVHRDPAPAAFDETRILHEDGALIAVDKPPGLPTVATADPARPHLVGLVERLLAARAPAAHAGVRHALGVHQRLDRDTSGAVVFVKDPAANADLGKQFASHRVEKTYFALTARPSRLPAGPWRTEDVAHGETKPAVTDFEVVEAWPEGMLVQARPRTGRKHQIRRHLSLAGMPILGDAAYGGDRSDAPRVMLHAARLQLRHPLTGTPLSVASALPADFQSAIARLRARPRGSLPRGTRRRR
jgi:23S rRNA pseudouridine1911/1915/1917 synthase